MNRLPAPPEIRWQLAQRQSPRICTGPSATNRRAPQKQPPVIVISKPPRSPTLVEERGGGQVGRGEARVGEVDRQVPRRQQRRGGCAQRRGGLYAVAALARQPEEA